MNSFTIKVRLHKYMNNLVQTELQNSHWNDRNTLNLRT